MKLSASVIEHSCQTVTAPEKCISDMTFWHGRCYSFLSTPMDVNAARDLCHRTHSTLTTIDTAEEMSWIITTLRAIPTVVTWHISEYQCTVDECCSLFLVVLVLSCLISQVSETLFSVLVSIVIITVASRDCAKASTCCFQIAMWCPSTFRLIRLPTCLPLLLLSS